MTNTIGTPRDTSWPPDWVCGDCLFMLAYGEAPSDMTEDELAGYQAQYDAAVAGVDITVGMFAEYHECTDESGKIVDDCECDKQTFSNSPCAICRGNAGERHAVTFWVKEGSGQ